MRRFVPLLLVTVALAELVVIAAVARSVGVGFTLMLLVLTFLVGAWLMKLAGINALRRFLATSSRGQVPHREIVDGFVLLAAGVLLLVPGLVTSAVGLLLLTPPVRALVRAQLVKRVTSGLFVESVTAARFGGTQVWDVDSVEVPVDRSARQPDDPFSPPSLSP